MKNTVWKKSYVFDIFRLKKDYVVSYGMFFFINLLPGGRSVVKLKQKKTVSINSCTTYYAQPSNEKTMRFKDIKLKYI